MTLTIWQQLGVGFLIGIMLIAVFLIIVWIYKKAILKFFIKKELKRTIDIFNNSKTNEQLVNELGKQNITNIEVIKKAREETKNGNIQQERTTTDTGNAGTDNKPRDKPTARQRNIPFKTATFGKSTNSGSRKTE